MSGFSRTFFETVDRRDVRMIQRRKRLCFACEPGKPIGVVRERVREDLQGDVAIEPGIARAIDLAHPAFADQRGDLVDTEAATGSECQIGVDYTVECDSATVRAVRRCDGAGVRRCEVQSAAAMSAPSNPRLSGTVAPSHPAPSHCLSHPRISVSPQYMMCRSGTGAATGGQSGGFWRVTMKTVIAFASVLLVGASAHAQTSSVSAAACERLAASLKLPNTTVTSAQARRCR